MAFEEQTEKRPLTDDVVARLNAYWRAANYLSVGQIYLLDNPLLRVPLTLEHVKPRLLGHWGTTSGLNFIYVHLNRLIRQHDLSVLYVTGPGHGGPGVVVNTYLEGSYTEQYPHITQNEAGMRKLFRQFSFRGGIPSHTSPETPSSINEGGELVHAYGAVFDNPDLLACCVVGDGEAETGTLAASWHSNKFLNPARDGAVLPVLHLYGYTIAGPTVLARMPDDEITSLFVGYGYASALVAGDEPEAMHQQMAAACDDAIAVIQRIQQDARERGVTERARWPMIVLRSPKGWTGPAVVDGLRIEGSFRSHQVPLSEPAGKPEHLAMLESWMPSYRPEELFGEDGRLVADLAALAPRGDRRMGSNPHANGGLLLGDLRMPDWRDYAIDVRMGRFLRLTALFDLTNRAWMEPIRDSDVHLAPDGRVMEVLSEQLCQGWLEGYLLTGRHGFFSCYEAFIHIVGSMFDQHAKWLDVTRDIPWRRPIASLSYLLTSHVWRQDHNGFSHQDPGFIDVVINKKAEVVRVYLPPDANTLLSVTDHCLRSRHYVNVIVAGKQPELQYLDLDAAIKDTAAGIGRWEWAGNDQQVEPDVAMACAGDVPTLETLAAVDLLRQHLPKLRVRVVNVVDLMRLQPARTHPHGLSDRAFDALFTTDTPVIFAYHGYPWLIHRLTYSRTNHQNFHVRGFVEEGSTTTPFDMTVCNGIDRFHLVLDVAEWVPTVGPRGPHVHQIMRDRLVEHHEYITRYGQDLPEIRGWSWPYGPSATT